MRRRTIANSLVFMALLSPICAHAAALAPVLLWPNGAPGSEDKTAAESVRITRTRRAYRLGVHRPSITPYLPEKASGAGVIVIPGGGHRELWMDHEGYRVGQWLKSTASRPSCSNTASRTSPAPPTRSKAKNCRCAARDPAGAQPCRRMACRAGQDRRHRFLCRRRIGSTRGHALRRGGARKPKDSIDRESARPAFMGLIYPAHPKDMRLTKDTPPAFLLCGADDSPAIAEGVPALYLSLKHAGVSAEMHILGGTGHGFGMREIQSA